MIIRNIWAENIFKFKKIELLGLPERGIIALSGANESGKSTLVDMISLALFGRTVTIAPEQLHQVVRWGETRASLTLEFTGRDRRDYSVTRYFDIEGAQQPALCQGGVLTPIIKGEGVDQKVVDLAGFNFEQFANILYLAPENLRTSASSSVMIKSLAGVEGIEKIAQRLFNEVQSLQAVASHLKENQEKLRLKHQHLALRRETLDELQEQLIHEQQKMAALDREIGQWRHFIEGFRKAASGVAAAMERFAKSTLDTGLDGWRARSVQLLQALDGFEGVCQEGEVELGEVNPLDGMRQWLSDFGQRLLEIETIFNQVDTYQRKILAWLGEDKFPHGPEPVSTESRFIDNRTPIVREKERLEKRYRRLDRGFVVAFFLAFFFCSGWGLLYFQPDLPISMAVRQFFIHPWSLQGISVSIPFLQDFLSQLQQMVGKYPPEAILGGTALLMLMAMLGDFGRSTKIKAKIALVTQKLTQLEGQAAYYREVIEIIESSVRQSLPRRVALLATIDEVPWQIELTEWLQKGGGDLLKEDDLARFLNKLISSFDQFQKDIQFCDAEAAAQEAQGMESRKKQEQSLQELQSRIEQEHQRRQEDQRLQEEIQDLHMEFLKQEHQIQVRQIATRLLKGTALELAKYFNQELQRFISSVVPILTGNRYQNLRLNNDLVIQVCSPKKKSYVDLAELSTGTRAQILLAVRVALAQAMATRSIKSPQFLVLDEPLAFFDRQRFQNTLLALPKIGEHLTQFWVVAAQFDSALPGEVGVHIHCFEDEDVLMVG
ncbi:MAG: AAA family ATPase [Magnetococcus sp. DMHC-6]